MQEPLYKGIGCGACLAVANETAHVIERLIELRINQEKTGDDVLGTTLASEFSLRAEEDLEKMCDTIDKYAMSSDGFLTVQKAFDVALKESNEYKATEAVRIDRAPYTIVREGTGLYTNVLEDKWNPDKKDSSLMTWFEYAQSKLQEACARVKDSDELAERLESNKKKVSLKFQRKLCENAKFCTKITKGRPRPNMNSEL
ncbi:hypothetical protein CYMTET_18120 [Cymbomonas tetramitiformis]|uniref:Uncharacterized protein n=1 Tax=Cymbomonas tetramitiformis TaxID=36881 RepID=A0AAE0GA18_9CHLO|nr:hypothetical protein CYMTET_18120 [Cymbomonas tetramitiformis]